jgi:hypothetical protein
MLLVKFIGGSSLLGCQMNVSRVLFSATILFLIATVTLSCGKTILQGSIPNRTLQSISVSPSIATVAADGQVQFVATGTFSAPPMTVTPLPVNWTGSWPVVPLWCISKGCAGMNPNGMAICFDNSTGVTITASAPSNPELPLDTPNVPMVSGTAILSCG